MNSPMPEAVATAVNAVMSNVGYIQKKGVNEFHRYKFAAVSDVLAKVQPAMADAGLIIIQDEIAHELIAGDAVMTATYAFRLMHKSGVEWDGQARHTGMAGAKNTKGGFDDKALNKCHTAARKYFIMALFQIPSGELADPDEDGDNAPPKPKAAAAVAKLPVQEAPATAPTFGDDPASWTPAEAIAWAETVSKGLEGFTLAALDKWEVKPETDKKLDRLMELDRETWKALKAKMTMRRKALEPKAA